MSESETLFRYVKAPMNLPMSDRVALLNIVVRDMQAGGARIFSTKAEGEGWLIEFMGEESLTEEVIQDGSYE